MVRIRFRQRCAMSASTGHASLERLHRASFEYREVALDHLA